MQAYPQFSLMEPFPKDLLPGWQFRVIRYAQLQQHLPASISELFEQIGNDGTVLSDIDICSFIIYYSSITSNRGT